MQVHDIAGLPGKFRVIAEFEGPHAVRLHIGRPRDSSHRRGAHAHRFGHAPRGPMGGIGGSFPGRFADDLRDLLRLDAARPPRARRVLQPLRPFLQKPLFPTLHGLPRNSQFLRNLLLGLARRRLQQDFGLLRGPHGDRAAVGPTREFRFLLRCPLDFRRVRHSVCKQVR
jgi:hypothetical protein